MYKIAVVGDYDSIYGFAGVFGNTGDGVQGVKDSVEQAVGSDILFSNN